ncbi:hypothetical protein C8R45DRAFT_291563 [Mycena sanguinolenta]|nr:hypothetical protein C8R45DRAFT_291563 [Mycena sanguinolenta]
MVTSFLPMTDPLPDLNATTGALLIGTWANSFLYMAELTQARYYFRHFKHDDWKLKTFVLVAFLIDTASTVGDYICVYLYTITHAGDAVYLANQHWPIPLYLFTTAVIAVLVQSFLIIRYWWFTRNIFVTLLNSCLCVAAFAGAVACGIIIAMFPAFRERKKVVIPATIWLVTEAVADLSIAAALLWELKKARPTLVDNRSALDRLVALTIRTGTATATLAVGTAIAFEKEDETNISVGIAYTLGRVYMLSMLANLNVRRSGKSPSSSGASSGAGLATLTIPSIISENYESSDFPPSLDNTPQQHMTFTGSCVQSFGDQSCLEKVATTSHPDRRQSESLVA